MQKKIALLTVLLWCLALNAGFSQEDNSLNDLLSICKKAKTETEDNGRLVTILVEKSDARYTESMKLYNQARSAFEEWIEYYLLETEDIIAKKHNEINEQALRRKISDALEAVRSFNSYVEQMPSGQNTPVARNYIPTVTEINTCFASAVGFLKVMKDAKREKQETMKKDLQARMSRYHITEFTALK